MLVFELTAKGQAITGGKLQLLPDGGAQLLHEPHYVPARHVAGDHCETIAPLALHQYRPLPEPDLRELVQRRLAAVGHDHQLLLQRRHSCRRPGAGGIHGKHDRGALLAFNDFRHLGTLQPGLQVAGEFGGGQAEALCHFRVHIHTEKLAAIDGGCLYIHAAGNLANDVGHPLGQAGEHGDIVAEYLHRQVPAATRQHLRNAHLYGLGEAEVDPGIFQQHRADIVDQLLLAGKAPLLRRLQLHEDIRLVEAHGVQSDFIGAGARHDLLDLGHPLQQGPFDLLVQGHRGRQGNAGGLFQLHDDIALVQHRHEGFAGEQESNHAEQQQGDEKQQQVARPLHHPLQAVLVGLLQPEHPGRYPRRVIAQQQGRDNRHHGQRQHQGREHGEHNRYRHRGEQLALQPGEGQQRRKYDQHDHRARHHRHRHILAGAVDQVQARQGLLARQLGNDVLHHHHRGVDDHADGYDQSAQAHQVGRQAGDGHQEKRRQCRQRQ